MNTFSMQKLAVATALTISALVAHAAATTVDGDYTLGTALDTFDGSQFTFTSGAGLMSGAVFEAPVGSNLTSVARFLVVSCGLQHSKSELEWSPMGVWAAGLPSCRHVQRAGVEAECVT